jgi:hypothetical protein
MLYLLPSRPLVILHGNLKLAVADVTWAVSVFGFELEWLLPRKFR